MRDISTAVLYDGMTMMVLLGLEAYGFCEEGQAWRWVLEHGIGLDSPLPVNPHAAPMGCQPGDFNEEFTVSVAGRAAADTSLEGGCRLWLTTRTTR